MVLDAEAVVDRRRLKRRVTAWRIAAGGVQTSCGAGFFLNSSGACEKRPEPAPKPKTVTREAPARAAPAAQRGGGKCFTFNGRTYCE